MTIITTTARAAELTASEETNNPFFTAAPFTGTYTTGGGTEVQPAANAFDEYTYTFWSATPNEFDRATLEIDLGSAQPANFVGIAAHNLGDVGAEYRIQYSDDGSSWTAATAPEGYDATDNSEIGLRFSAGSRRYWRLRLDNLTGTPSVGLFYLSTDIVLPRRIYQGYTPALTPNQVDLNTNVSEGGNFLGAAYTERGSTFQASFSNVSPTFLRGADWLAFQQRWNRGNPAFWAWRPTKYGDLFYAWRSQGMAPITPTNTGPGELMGFTVQGRMYDQP